MDGRGNERSVVCMRAAQRVLTRVLTRVLNGVFGEFLVKLRDLKHSVFDKSNAMCLFAQRREVGWAGEREGHAGERERGGEAEEVNVLVASPSMAAE